MAENKQFDVYLATATASCTGISRPALHSFDPVAGGERISGPPLTLPTQPLLTNFT